MSGRASALHQDPAFLRVAYWGREQSVADIADVCGVGTTAVRYQMQKHGIPRRGPLGVALSREKLLADVRRVADEVDGVPSILDYRERGAHANRTIHRRFGGWADALVAAGVLGGGE